jgi:hypothetical protein
VEKLEVSLLHANQRNLYFVDVPGVACVIRFAGNPSPFVTLPTHPRNLVIPGDRQRLFGCLRQPK